MSVLVAPAKDHATHDNRDLNAVIMTLVMMTLVMMIMIMIMRMITMMMIVISCQLRSLVNDYTD